MVVGSNCTEPQHLLAALASGKLSLAELRRIPRERLEVLRHVHTLIFAYPAKSYACNRRSEMFECAPWLQHLIRIILHLPWPSADVAILLPLQLFAGRVWAI